MDQVLAELLKYGLPGLGLVVVGWAYMQERSDRKTAETRLLDYLGKDREALLSVCQLATATLGEAAQAHKANKDYIAALSVKIIDRTGGRRPGAGV